MEVTLRGGLKVSGDLLAQQKPQVKDFKGHLGASFQHYATASDGQIFAKKNNQARHSPIFRAHPAAKRQMRSPSSFSSNNKQSKSGTERLVWLPSCVVVVNSFEGLCETIKKKQLLLVIALSRCPGRAHVGVHLNVCERECVLGLNPHRCSWNQSWLVCGCQQAGISHLAF